MFSWDSIPGEDNDKLKRFLMDDFDIDWAKNAEICKCNGGMTINITQDNNSAEIRMDKTKEKATLKISDCRTYELKVKPENGKLNIYKKHKNNDARKKVRDDAFNSFEKILKEYCLLEEYLFSIDAKFEDELSKGNISKELKDKFETKEISLSEFTIENEYLFSIDTKFEDDLNDCNISEDMKKEFEKNGFSLPDNADVKKEEEKWAITDGKKCIIRKEEGKLNIYENENKWKLSYGEKAFIVRKEDKKLNVYRERGDLGSCFNDLKCFKDSIEKKRKTMTKQKQKNTETEVSVLMRVKTKYIAEYFILMKLFEVLCSSESPKFAEIKNVSPVFGPYDFLWRIRAEGESEGESNNKINGTILKIREIFNSCIDETITLIEFELKMTKEELKKFFKRFLGVETIAKKVVGEIPEKTKSEISLIKEISTAEITPLKNLLKEAKKSFDPEYLKIKMDDLTKRIEELEKRNNF